MPAHAFLSRNANENRRKSTRRKLCATCPGPSFVFDVELHVAHIPIANRRKSSTRKAIVQRNSVATNSFSGYFLRTLPGRTVAGCYTSHKHATHGTDNDLLLYLSHLSCVTHGHPHDSDPFHVSRREMFEVCSRGIREIGEMKLSTTTSYMGRTLTVPM